MIRIAIVDDELHIAKSVAKSTQHHAEQLGVAVNLSIFQSSRKFLEDYRAGSFDAAFLDIEMPELNGDALSAELTKIDPALLLVYVTNCCNDEVYTMLKYMPIGFLRKPLFEQEIDNMLSVLQAKITAMQKLYTVQSGKQVLQIPLKDVVYIDSEKNYVYFHMVKKPQKTGTKREQPEEIIKVRKKLDEVQAEIENNGFIRIHSGILVNYRYIYAIQKNTVRLDNGLELAVSRSHEATVSQKFLYFSRG